MDFPWVIRRQRVFFEGFYGPNDRHYGAGVVYGLLDSFPNNGGLRVFDQHPSRRERLFMGRLADPLVEMIEFPVANPGWDAPDRRAALLADLYLFDTPARLIREGLFTGLSAEISWHNGKPELIGAAVLPHFVGNRLKITLGTPEPVNPPRSFPELIATRTPVATIFRTGDADAAARTEAAYAGFDGWESIERDDPRYHEFAAMAADDHE